MCTDELDYWRARAMQEQIAALKASCGAAQRAHDRLATMCRLKVSLLSQPLSEWEEAQATRFIPVSG